MHLRPIPAQVGVVQVHDRETRRLVGRLAVVHHYLAAHFTTHVIGGKSPCTVRFPVVAGPKKDSMFNVRPL